MGSGALLGIKQTEKQLFCVLALTAPYTGWGERVRPTRMCGRVGMRSLARDPGNGGRSSEFALALERRDLKIHRASARIRRRTAQAGWR